MDQMDHYVHAATRASTRSAYQSAIRHYELEWGGFLPATPDNVARYLADHAGKLAMNTLRQRLAALSQWHTAQGFPDPTKADVIKKVVRGIQMTHPEPEKQARPVQLEQLAQADRWLHQTIAEAHASGNRITELRATRNRAMLLLGFWRGFRGDELTRLRVEHVELVPDQGMLCYLPHTKTAQYGIHFKTPALSQYCPVAAYTAWKTLSMLEEGPVFRAIDRWGHLGREGLHADSLAPLLRRMLSDAEIANSENFSAHSLRRGFATWATRHGWDLKTLMAYVGWKSMHSAMRYVDAADPFAQHRMERSLSTGNPIGTPLPVEACTT